MSARMIASSYGSVLFRAADPNTPAILVHRNPLACELLPRSSDWSFLGQQRSWPLLLHLPWQAVIHVYIYIHRERRRESVFIAYTL